MSYRDEDLDYKIIERNLDKEKKRKQYIEEHQPKINRIVSLSDDVCGHHSLMISEDGSIYRYNQWVHCEMTRPPQGGDLYKTYHVKHSIEKLVFPVDIPDELKDERLEYKRN